MQRGPVPRRATHIMAALATAAAAPVAAQHAVAPAAPPRSLEAGIIMQAAPVTGLTFPDDSDRAVLRPDDFARPTLDVMIGGEGPFRFLVDTGAQATAISRALALRLALPQAGRATLVATGSRRTVDLVEVGELSFANRTVTLPGSPVLDEAHVGADGILGLDTLQDLRVLMDFRRRAIFLSDSRAAVSSGPFEIVVRARKRLGQMIIMDAEVDGVRTAVVVDTGADVSIGNPVLEQRLRARQRGVATGTDVNGVAFATAMRLAQQVRVGDMTVAQVPIGFASSPAFEALGLDRRPALILGMGALRGLDRLAIDFPGQKVMFDLPASAPRASAWRRNPFAP
ncbi:aspartyl protease family protein [Qipengyuania thermophila]|uniref:aspartyl protease family protein n=1 Tax=Qipengyuania thermophila TaxID=2509361 RepID=UPI0013ECE8E9|nr:aspartyl protease family protein [Qipengyuania thermophila]